MYIKTSHHGEARFSDELFVYMPVEA